jgi:hypothetical protein
MGLIGPTWSFLYLDLKTPTGAFWWWVDRAGSCGTNHLNPCKMVTIGHQLSESGNWLMLSLPEANANQVGYIA